MIGRRIFIQGLALVASAPAFAATLLYGPPQMPVTANGEKTSRVVVKINGWDQSTDATHGGGLDSEETIWLGVNRAWRANWR